MTMQLQLWIYIVVMAIAIECGHSHRIKREIAFPKGSTFFYRLNYKINSVVQTTIFAHASGFKVAWPLPDGSRTRRSIGNILNDINLLYESHGLSGGDCLAKNICEATSYIEQTNGVLMKILKVLASISNANLSHAEDSLLNCGHHVASCPLQLINVNSFIES